MCPVMASPLSTGKRSVDLTAGGVRVSRIRRDPPPKEKEREEIDPKEREARMLVLGVTAFLLAICVVMVGLGSMLGWSPSHYTIAL